MLRRPAGRADARRLPPHLCYPLAFVLNSALGFLGQFAFFYFYYVARDVLANLGIGSWGIPFRDGYLGALVLGFAALTVYAAIMAAANLVVVRFSSVSRRPYWGFAVIVSSASSAVQLLWNMGEL
ncbi:hypothetical protein Sru01_11260 [Sphaerisporangium rufum]|uniref:Uncharacterized protein n=1 Tax=Sphaerisporangium rufum TaxID=1381558 RepID=A0A919QXZ2_9ACTN|nr:hypothetical protein [Sphaerisporangium rufum]GII76144.1 hypothetical protein Sru01_11260 [Sphaerisporangium rufum]